MAANASEIHELVKYLIEHPGAYLQDRGWDRLGMHMTIKRNRREKYWEVLIDTELQSLAHQMKILRKMGTELKGPIFDELEDLSKKKSIVMDARKIICFDGAEKYKNFMIEKSIAKQAIRFQGKQRAIKANVLFKKIDKCMDLIQKAIKKNRKLYAIYLKKEIKRFSNVKKEYETKLAEVKEQYARIDHQPIITENKIVKPYIDAMNIKWQLRYRKHLGFYKKQEAEEIQKQKKNIWEVNCKIQELANKMKKTLTVQTLR